VQPLIWAAFPIIDSVKWPGFDLLVEWNDIFFMALMFFVSGLFVWPSLRRHGTGKFIQRRMLRLGIPFILAAGVLAPVAYFPAFVQSTGDTSWISYAHAWLALGNWPAGPAWFLWVLLVFDGVAALCFAATPRVVELLAGGVRKISSRPALLFLSLTLLSFAAYVPMSIRFGGEAWWGWGPFSVQSNRVIHYFVYFGMGVSLGALGTENPLFERKGPLARRWWLWGLGMAVAFQAIVALALTGRALAAKFMFPVSCAASSIFVIALVIRFARPLRWADSLSANAYGIYLLHYIFVIWVQYAALHWALPAFVKGLAVWIVAVGLSWMTTTVMRQSKMVERRV
jgi:hypothetical protein